jgi:hypothetical protein
VSHSGRGHGRRTREAPDRAVQGAVLQDLRRTLAPPLSLAGIVGLLACPQLSPDDFGSTPSGTDSSCVRLGTCNSGSGGTALGAAGGEPGTGGSASGTGGATAGTGGFAPGTGGSTPASGGSSSDAGSGGQSTSAGSGGTGGSGTTADAGPQSTPDPGCRTLLVDDSTHSADDNCVGIRGWNEVVTDPGTASDVGLSYRNGKACFEGTVEPVGWGAVYNFTFANEQAWDATDFDVEGFRLDFTGPSLPPSIRVVYTAAASDYCQRITPLSTASLLFANSHPNCTGTPGSGTPPLTSLTFLRVVLPPSTAAFDVDFCVSLTAIP